MNLKCERKVSWILQVTIWSQNIWYWFKRKTKLLLCFKVTKGILIANIFWPLNDYVHQKHIQAEPVIFLSHYSPKHNFYFPAQRGTSFKWTTHVEMPLGLGAPDTDMLWEASEKGELDSVIKSPSLTSFMEFALVTQKYSSSYQNWTFYL